MNKYVITGGIPLHGQVKISGSKNSALPIMAATLLCDEPVVLHNIPLLKDTLTMRRLLEKLGKKIETLAPNSIRILPHRDDCYQADYKIVKQMRASICVLGPLLAKRKQAQISFPGGCAFGPRPIDLHIRGLEQLGAKIENHHGYLEATAEHLVGKKVDLRGTHGPSVLGTDNVLTAATLAEGTTIIENAAREPETQDLVEFLNHLGAKISGSGQSTLTIEGVDRLQGGEYTVIEDRIEAGTYLIFSAITEGEVEILYRFPDHLESVLLLAREIGIEWTAEPSKIQVKSKRLQDYQAFSFTTLPFPGFPTDLQPMFSTLATLIPGNSTASENIYANRFAHTYELQRMGAKITVEHENAIIKGVDHLEAADVQASDLRGCAALVAAGLAAEGDTQVRRIYHGERGYENLVEKLSQLQARIQVEKDSLV